ncbi:MAG: hypothetical protein V9G10_04160 [Candidatus Nanopelagicales bacterium]
MIAFDTLEAEARSRQAQRTAWQDGDEPLPALYVSHGAPPLFEDEPWMRRAVGLGR